MKQRLSFLISFLFVSTFTFSQSDRKSYPGRTKLQPALFPGITGRIFDDETGNALPARIVISDDSGKIYDSYYKHLPGFFTSENGDFQQQLGPGNYTLTVFHSLDYRSRKLSFTIKDGSGLNAEIFLKPWHSLKKSGWVCGDGHDHLYTEKKPDTAMLSTLRKICLAQGIDFVCAAQGWGGYNDSTWRNGYARFNDNRFTLSYGSEMPKYRTGHTWWLGQKSTRNYFWNSMDTVYENDYYQSAQGTSWNFRALDFPFIPDVEIVRRFKNADLSVAIMAHPTSWWWQKRGDIEKYVTNAAANLSFGLLSGKIWDGVVVMGYDHDHYFYQNLWFHILNEGYRMPAISELDGGFEKDDKHYFGSMRTYYKINGNFTVEKLAAAVKWGKTFVTSGPIIFADVDGKYGIGDIVRSAGQIHDLHINAYASGEAEDYLSYIVVYRNGKIFKLWDTRSKKPAAFNKTIKIAEKDKAWYVIKVYGKNAWKDPSRLDLMQVCEKIPGENKIDSAWVQHEVAITSPFYFWPSGEKDPPILQSKVNVSVISPLTKQAFKNVSIDILVSGKKINTIHLKNGNGAFKLPVNGYLKIRAQGYPTIYRGLYLDYLPHQELLEELASGKWMKNYDSTKKFNAGEIPWEEFHFKKTKEILSTVDWEIEMVPNKRDKQWDGFERIFK